MAKMRFGRNLTFFFVGDNFRVVLFIVKRFSPISTKEVKMIIGIDYGTSNSTCFVQTKCGRVQPVILEPDSLFPNLLPSYIYFSDDDRVFTGSEAKQEFINNNYTGRFILSIKSHLNNLSLRNIIVWNRMVKLEELVAIILRRIKMSVEQQFGEEITEVRAGRPVCFSDDTKIDRETENRLKDAYKKAGFADPIFLAEPLAAAYTYKQVIKTPEIVLICDFGGGTLDYCVILLVPQGNTSRDTLLGTYGVRLGGDDVTAVLTQLFWKYFGYESKVLNFERNDWLPFPRKIFFELSNWKNIWMLKKFLDKVEGYIQWGSSDPVALRRLISLLCDEYYYLFFAQIEKTKIELSSKSDTVFSFNKYPLHIESNISRSDFEEKLKDVLDRANRGLSEVLRRSGVVANKIQSVFLTGGSSQIPAFKRMVERTCGAGKIHEGNSFTSVGEGLVLYDV